MIRILIVDDEPHTREFLREKIPIFNADCIVASCCSDGREALEFLERKDASVDLILTDIKMPIMDGLELSQKVRVKYPDIPVVILTGFRDFDFAQQAIQNGVSSYILKPIVNADLKQLLQKMTTLIEMKKEEENKRKHKERLLTLLMPNADERNVLNPPVHTHNKKKPEENLSIVEAAMAYILRNYSRPISLSMVAEEIGVSTSYLSSIFHYKTGESYVKYLTRVRMKIAADYLDDYPAMLISDIAERTGFINIKHFFYVFRKFFGMTPTEYREKKKDEAP